MTITEIKQAAKIKLSGAYAKCASTSLLYFIAVTILTYISKVAQVNLETHTIILTVIQAIFALISILLSYGLIANIIALTNNETKSITKFVDYSVTNSMKYTKVILRVLVRILIPLILFLLSIFYLIGTTIAHIKSYDFLCFHMNYLPFASILCLILLGVLIYFILKYILVAFIYNSDSNQSAIDIVNKSKELMKGKKLNYILLILSFFGWILLTAIILSILGNFIDAIYLTPIVIAFFSLIRPYVVISELIFYENLEQ